jgi:hypothetical protein
MALRLCGICNLDQPIRVASGLVNGVWYCGAPCAFRVPVTTLCLTCNVVKPTCPATCILGGVWYCGAPCLPPRETCPCGVVHPGPLSVSAALPSSRLYAGNWYCCFACRHLAGDRSTCRSGCGCSRLARCRRRLRDHRAQMRVMEEYARSRRFRGGMIDAVQSSVGRMAYLGDLSSLDGSTSEGEEDDNDALRAEVVGLRHENSDRQNLLCAVSSLARR